MVIYLHRVYEALKRPKSHRNLILKLNLYSQEIMI